MVRGNWHIIKIILFSLVLAMLIYPGFDKLYFYSQRNELEDLSLGPFEFLGENQTILSNYDRFSRYNTKYKDLDILLNRDLFIGIKNEFLQHAKYVNLEQERSRVFLERWNQLNDTYNKLSRGEYSLIVYGPLESTLDLFWLVQFNQLYQETDSNKVDIDDYCLLSLHSTEHGCNECNEQIRIFFKDNKTCEKTLPYISDYYSNNFHKICKLDEITANSLRTMLIIDKLFVNATCKDGGRLLIRYNNKIFRPIDILNIIYLSALFLFAFARKRKTRLLITLVVLIILALFLYLANENYVKMIPVDETLYDPYTYQIYQSVSTPAYLASSKEPVSILPLDNVGVSGIWYKRYTNSNISIGRDLKGPKYIINS